jgi:RHS repeat-associated protein
LKHKGYNNATSPNGNSTAQKFKYNGVELNEGIGENPEGLNLYEMEWRGYDPTVGRFMQVDPLAELYEQLDKSTYSFAWNNPIYFNDPLGLCPECPDGKEEGQIYNSDGGETYVYEKGSWVRQGGNLDEIVIPAGGGSSATSIGPTSTSGDPNLGFIPPPGGLIKPTPIQPLSPTSPKVAPRAGSKVGKGGLLLLWALFVQPTNATDFQLDPGSASKLPRDQSAVIRVQFQQGHNNMGSQSAYNTAQNGVTVSQANLALSVARDQAIAQYKKIILSPQAKFAIARMMKKIESIRPNGIVAGTRTTLQETFKIKDVVYRIDVESILGHNLRK